MSSDTLRNEIARKLGWRFDPRTNRWLHGDGSIRLAPPNPENNWADAGPLLAEVMEHDAWHPLAFDCVFDRWVVSFVDIHLETMAESDDHTTLSAALLQAVCRAWLVMRGGE